MATSVMRCTIPRLSGLIRAQIAHRPLGDVLGQVRAPFELGQDQQQAHQVAQDPAAGLPLELGPHRQLDRCGELVHLLVAVDHRLGDHRVVVQQRVGRLGQCFGDQGEQLAHLLVDQGGSCALFDHRGRR